MIKQVLVELIVANDLPFVFAEYSRLNVFVKVGREVRAIGDDPYDVGKGFVDKTLCWKGVGRVGEGIEVTAVL